MQTLLKGVAVLMWLIALAAAATHFLGILPPPGMQARTGGPELYETHFQNYERYTWSTWIHVVFGGLLAVLMPFQLSGWIRRASLPLHRVSGWLFVAFGLLAVSSGTYLATVMPFGGVPETIVVVPMAILFVWCLASGVRLAQAGEVQRHRRWMARAIAIALSIATQRILFIVAMLLEWWPPRTAFLIALSLAPLLNFAVAEWMMGSRQKPEIVARYSG